MQYGTELHMWLLSLQPHLVRWMHVAHPCFSLMVDEDPMSSQSHSLKVAMQIQDLA